MLPLECVFMCDTSSLYFDVCTKSGLPVSQIVASFFIATQMCLRESQLVAASKAAT